MKISYSWLKEYIQTDLSPEEVSVLLTDGGLEVEGLEKVESIKGGLKGIKIGKVLSCEKHSNADKLSVTTVEIDNGKILPIVCGAPNVAKDQKVLVATVGTMLYQGEESFQIKKSKIRGEVSEGMICAEDELGLGSSHDGIMVLDDDAPVGAEAASYFDIQEDYVFEIGLTPNRADATSHIGTARDLVAVINRFYPEKKAALIIPAIHDNKITSKLDIKVVVENQKACPRYSGVVLTSLKIGESPKWLQDRLKAVGIRPINNIVDITNFVMMETGQPLHAFDYDKIEGKTVRIKNVAEGKTFVTLDGVERKLTATDLLICNDNEPMCLAGIFGGAKSGVTNTTQSIFIESAYFDPATTRKSSKHHGLKTDASFRFERGADPNMTIFAIRRALDLLVEYADAQVASDIIDVYPEPIKPWTIFLSTLKLKTIVGTEIPLDMAEQIATDLEMKVLEKSPSGLLLEIPTFKVDVTREIDVIEEILRVYGYNQIETDLQLKSAISFTEKPEKERIKNITSDFLVAKGYFEGMNNSLSKSSLYQKYGFEEQNNVVILNPLSNELNVMRQSLIFGLLENAKRNINHKQASFKIFEFGKHYTFFGENDALNRYHEEEHLALLSYGNELSENWKYKDKASDFYSLKSIVLSFIEKLGIQSNDFKTETATDHTIYSQCLIYTYKQKQIMSIGILKDELCKSFDIDKPIYYADLNWELIVKATLDYKVNYQDLNKFPAVRRDLALLVDKNVQYKDIEQIAFKTEKKLLKSVSLFDVYMGKGIDESKKSYAISLVLQDPNKTLTDKNIDKIIKKIQYRLEQELGAQLR